MAHAGVDLVVWCRVHRFLSRSPTPPQPNRAVWGTSVLMFMQVPVCCLFTAQVAAFLALPAWSPYKRLRFRFPSSHNLSFVSTSSLAVLVAGPLEEIPCSIALRSLSTLYIFHHTRHHTAASISDVDIDATCPLPALLTMGQMCTVTGCDWSRALMAGIIVYSFHKISASGYLCVSLYSHLSDSTNFPSSWSSVRYFIIMRRDIVLVLVAKRPFFRRTM
jgi:hypothetical protein